MPERAARNGDHGMHTGVIAAVLGALGLVVLGTTGVVHLLASSWGTPLAGANAPMDMRLPEPRLESAPQYDRTRYFAEKEALLGGYAWVDREKGVAHIPIELAMKLIASEAGAKSKRGERNEGAAP